MKGKQHKQITLLDSIEQIEKEELFLKSINDVQVTEALEVTTTKNYSLKELSIKLRQEPDFIKQLI